MNLVASIYIEQTTTVFNFDIIRIVLLLPMINNLIILHKYSRKQPKYHQSIKA